MCEADTWAENLADHAARSAMSRRAFGGLAAASAMAAAFPAFGADEVESRAVQVPMAEGQADGFLVHPRTGRHPGVVLWPDILGLRPAIEAMARRLAAEGYAVLVLNPYYRVEPAPVVPVGATFTDTKVREKVIGLKQGLTVAMTVADAIHQVRYLDQLPAVDPARPIGTLGYCMGGPFAFRTAAAAPARVGALASFHGGGLVTESEDSPHKQIPTMTAAALVAIAATDHEKEPLTKGELERAFQAVQRSAEVEVYPAAHGWCPTDSAVYDAVQAERAWARLLHLFTEHLTPPKPASGE